MNMCIKWYDNSLNEYYKKIRTYKTWLGANNRLEKEANERFGEGNWEKREDRSRAMSNLVGWYAVDGDGYSLELTLLPPGQ